MQLTLGLLNYLSYIMSNVLGEKLLIIIVKYNLDHRLLKGRKNHSFYFAGRETEQREHVNPGHLFQCLELFPPHHVKMPF